MKVSLAPAFNFFINLCIILNTGVLAWDHLGASATEIKIMEYANLAFSVVFFMEMFVKLLGLGFKEYFRDRFNDFDAVIVFISTLDILFTYSSLSSSGGSGAISALRGFRLLRIFKLAKSWK